MHSQSLLDVNIEDILKAYEDKTVDELKKVIYKACKVISHMPLNMDSLMMIK